MLANDLIKQLLPNVSGRLLHGMSLACLPAAPSASCCPTRATACRMKSAAWHACQQQRPSPARTLPTCQQRDPACMDVHHQSGSSSGAWPTLRDALQVISIAEDVSGMPGLGRPVAEGGEGCNGFRVLKP